MSIDAMTIKDTIELILAVHNAEEAVLIDLIVGIAFLAAELNALLFSEILNVVSAKMLIKLVLIKDLLRIVK